MSVIVKENFSRTNIYLKGLSEDFTDLRLKELVPDHSQVKSVRAALEDNGKCRGYGFIDFYTEEAAQFAIRYLQQNFPSFRIKFAVENEKDKTNLYVTNLPKNWTGRDSDRLKEIFVKFGTIQSAFIMIERSVDTNGHVSLNFPRSRSGVGFVRFAKEIDAQAALDTLRTHPLTLAGCDAPLEVKFADKHSNQQTRKRRNNATSHNSENANSEVLQTSSKMPILLAPNPLATLSIPSTLYTSIYGGCSPLTTTGPLTICTPSALSVPAGSYQGAAAPAPIMHSLSSLLSSDLGTHMFGGPALTSHLLPTSNWILNAQGFGDLAAQLQLASTCSPNLLLRVDPNDTTTSLVNLLRNPAAFAYMSPTQYSQ